MKGTTVFAILPEKGHVNPYIGPAQALRDLGHEVMFISPKDISEQLTPAGLRFDAAIVDPGDGGPPMRGESLVSLVKDRAAMREWIAQLLLEVPDGLVQRIRWFFESQRPDVVVVDPLFYPAVIAAHLAGCKWVAMSNSLNPVLNNDVASDLLETLSVLKERRSALFERYGLEQEFRGCDALSNDLTIAFCTEDFIGGSVAGVEMVGPSMPLYARGDEVDFNEPKPQPEPQPQPEPEPRPVVYASFGSQIYHWPKIFRALVEACGDLDVRLILSVGDLKDTLAGLAWPDFVELYSYAPQLSILPRARVFITHGGANSVMEALHFSVPVLISPMCNDQFHQAYYVDKSGVGIVCDLQRADVAVIRAAITKLLTDEGIRARVTAVSRSYQVSGAKRSAQLIGSLL